MAILGAIFNISKCSMMPEWPEKLENQVPGHSGFTGLLPTQCKHSRHIHLEVWSKKYNLI